MIKILIYFKILQNLICLENKLYFYIIHTSYIIVFYNNYKYFNNNIKIITNDNNNYLITNIFSIFSMQFL